jgi:hypothetical protein
VGYRRYCYTQSVMEPFVSCTSTNQVFVKRVLSAGHEGNGHQEGDALAGILGYFIYWQSSRNAPSG